MNNINLKDAFQESIDTYESNDPIAQVDASVLGSGEVYHGWKNTSTVDASILGSGEVNHDWKNTSTVDASVLGNGEDYHELGITNTVDFSILCNGEDFHEWGISNTGLGLGKDSRKHSREKIPMKTRLPIPKRQSDIVEPAVYGKNAKVSSIPIEFSASSECTSAGIIACKQHQNKASASSTDTAMGKHRQELLDPWKFVEQLIADAAKSEDSLVKDIPEIPATVKSIPAEPFSCRSHTTENRSLNSSASESAPVATAAVSGPLQHEAHARSSSYNQQEIYEGTGVMCDKTIWLKARRQTTGTGFVRCILSGVFDFETLLACNLKGKPSTRDPTAPPKPALDALKREAIYCATLSHFPATPIKEIGIAINGKLTELRRREKKKSAGHINNTGSIP